MKLQPAVAGTFYPSQPKQLTKIMEGWEKAVHPVEVPGLVMGLMLPHAGYAYSGSVAALGYMSAGDKYDTVVVVGPSHYVPFQGASLFAGEAVHTPLGDVPVDQEACRFMMESHESLRELPAAWEREHSVEVHFPLLKRFMPKAKVIPIVTGHCVGRYSEALAGTLGALRKRRNLLFIASTDLCHYPDYATAVEKDQEFLKAILTGDPETVDKADDKILASGHGHLQCTHCGHEPLQALLAYAQGQGAGNIRLLKYLNSGDVTGEKDRVVGYAAVAFCK